MRLEGLVVANLHATNDFRDPQIAAAEIVRAEAFVTGVAGSLPCILAGDFNLRAEHLLRARRAGPPAARESTTCSCAGSPRRRSPSGRSSGARHNGAVLSDHAPVEVTIG